MQDDGAQEAKTDVDDEATSAQEDGDAVGEYLDPEVDAGSLIEGLKGGQLTPRQQEILSTLLDEDGPQHNTVTIHQRSAMYKGPLPPAEHFNAYDEQTRSTILKMAVDDQSYVHDMNKLGLVGSIEKDKRGQCFGLTIALAGLLAATVIAPFSPWVAGLIGALDLFGMVALFVAPRVLEGRAKQQASSQDGSRPSDSEESDSSSEGSPDVENSR